MSTTHGSGSGETFEAGKAFDGFYLPDESEELAYMAHSEAEATPWIRVDLQAIYTVVAMNILNRACKYYFEACYLFIILLECCNILLQEYSLYACKDKNE